MVALRRTAGDFLLVREVLLAIEQNKWANRRLVVTTSAQGRADDPEPSSKTEVVCARPTAAIHRGVDLSLMAQQRQIYGISE
jgi:hypothetical protein